MGDRVLGLAFGGRGDGELLVLIAAGEQHDVADAEAAFGQRAGLVKDDGIEIARPFEGGAVADQEAVAGAQRRADGDHERNGKAEGVRTGDDHHCHHALDRELEGASEHQPPDEQRPEADQEGDVGQPGGGAVGDVLGARAWWPAPSSPDR